jgi:glutathione peroxidase
MRRCLSRLLLVLLASAAMPAAAACPALFDRNMSDILEKPRSLCEYAGKVVLVVNTASECGYTPQYEGLEALYRKYRDRGLVVIGFPSNDFGGQEPGSNKEIAAFCVNQYAIDFPMFAKTSVRGPQANALFAELARATGVAPRWNFHKYLVARDGKRVQSFDTRVAPADTKLVGAIEKLLGE